MIRASLYFVSVRWFSENWRGTKVRFLKITRYTLGNIHLIKESAYLSFIEIAVFQCRVVVKMDAGRSKSMIPYFFSYKTEFFFFFQNNPKIDLSYKTDLDLSNCFGRVKQVL